MRYATILLLSTIFVGSPLTSNALALREFKKAFERHYAELLEDDAVKTTFRKAKCNLCHQKGEKKELNNPYGDALAELIEGDAEDRVKAAKENGTKKEELEKILTELDAALGEVEAQESPDGTSFGERIRGGQLPVEIPPGDDEEDEEEEDEDDEEEDEASGSEEEVPIESTRR